MAEARTEAQNRQRLDALMPRYQRLNAERIRVEGDIERLQGEVTEAEKDAMEAFKTTDAAQIAKILEDARGESTAAVDAFGSTIEEIEKRLNALNQGAQ